MAGNKAIFGQTVLELASLVCKSFLRDLIIRRYLEKLEGVNVRDSDAVHEWKIIKYLKQWQLTFDNATGLFSTKMASGVFESSPGYSSFLSNALESLWGVIDSLVPCAELELTVATLLSELEKVHTAWFEDFHFSSLVHFPSDANSFTPALMRGEGRLCVLMACTQSNSDG